MITFLGGGLLAAGIVLFVLQPVLTGRSARLPSDADDPTEGEARKRVALIALRDLEYDRATGKVDDEDYRELKSELSREALDVLGGAGPADGAAADGAGAAHRVELARLEAEIQEAREGLRTGATCLTCGHTNRAASRFCSRCGTPLAVVVKG